MLHVRTYLVSTLFAISSCKYGIGRPHVTWPTNIVSTPKFYKTCGLPTSLEMSHGKKINVC